MKYFAKSMYETAETRTRRRELTAQMHERCAKALDSVGKHSDAKIARRLAAKCRTAK